MSLFVCFYCLIGLVGASRGLSRKVMFLVTNYRIFLTRRTSCHAENHGWSRMSVMNFLFYHELSNYRIVSSHGESRKVTNYRIFFTRSVAEGHRFFITRLVLGPTDQREVIIELSNIFHTECRGMSRIFFCPDFFFLSRICELFSSHGESRRLRIFFIPRLVLGPTGQREVIVEFSNCFLHTKCRGWLWGLLFM